MANTQGLWCLIGLEKLQFSHLRAVDILTLGCPHDGDCPHHCKAVNSIPDIHRQHVKDSSFLYLVMQNALPHRSCP